MRNRKSTIIGVICGIACALTVLFYMNTVQAEASAVREEILSRYGGDQVEACVAARDISAGHTITSEDIVVKTWIADLFPEKAVLSAGDIVGKKVTSPIYNGEVFTERRFEQSDGVLEVPEGTSALSVPTKDVQAIGGSVSAGMRIDLYTTGQTTTSILARDVLILATSSSESTNTSNGFSWVTLALKNESVEEVIAASQKTELYFVLPG